jgi:hypothetical protein
VFGMNFYESVAIVLPRLPASNSYTLIEAVDPQIDRKLRGVFRESAVFAALPVAMGSMTPEQPIAPDGRVVPIREANRLAAARRLAETFADRPPSLVIAIGDCTLVRAVLTLRRAGLGFARTRMLAIVDSADRTSSKPLADAADLLLGTALDEEAVGLLDRLIDVRQASDAELGLIGALLHQPAALPDHRGGAADFAPNRWAILGPHSPARLNAILDANEADGIEIIGEANCAAVSGRDDLERFDLIPRWSRDATLRNLLRERRIAVVPPGAGLERLDCALHAIPVSEDLRHYTREAPPPKADLRDLVPPPPSAARPSRRQRAEDVEKVELCADTGPGESVMLNWEMRDRCVEMPPLARLRPAATAALAHIDADIVVAGVSGDGDRELVMEPVSPNVSLITLFSTPQVACS